MQVFSRGVRAGRSDELLPVLDRQAALASVDGDPALLAEVAAVFLGEHARMRRELRDAVAARTADAIMRTAHRIKGAASAVAGRRAAAAALCLEQMGRSGELLGLPEATEALEHELDRLVAALGATEAPPARAGW